MSGIRNSKNQKTKVCQESGYSATRAVKQFEEIHGLLVDLEKTGNLASSVVLQKLEYHTENNKGLTKVAKMGIGEGITEPSDVSVLLWHRVQTLTLSDFSVCCSVLSTIAQICSKRQCANCFLLSTIICCDL